MIRTWQKVSRTKKNELLFPGKDGESPMWPNIWFEKRILPTARAAAIENITF